jgi:[acyl-carrier-protein] S-malonyltransferase
VSAVVSAPPTASRLEMTAWLFPGQGAEAGGRLRVRRGPMTRLLEHAGRALGMDLAFAIAHGDPALSRTEIAQPALVAVCLGIADELEAEGVVPDAVAGHSLGELAATAVAGCISVEDAIGLAVERGRLMAEAARERPGAMAAVRASDEAAVERLVAFGRAGGRLTIAGRNSPTQWTLSGDRAALDALAATMPVTFLPTSGAWHSEAMAEAEDRWLAILRLVAFRPARRPLILNRDGRALRAGDDPAALLAGQLTRPLEWLQTLETLAQMGVAKWVTIGPGRGLRALCREALGASVNVVMASGERRP